jgi:acetyltransferase
MLDETRLSSCLNGTRGARAVDRDAIVDALRGLARLVQSVGQVQDVEVNPLLAFPEGCVALDARVLVMP